MDAKCSGFAFLLRAVCQPTRLSDTFAVLPRMACDKRSHSRGGEK